MTASTEAAAISDGPLPKHLQLTTLLTALATHELSPGEAIPSERELMTRYAVSRATVRRSIESLISDGLLRAGARQGHLRRPPPAGEPAAPRVVQPGHAPPGADALDPAARSWRRTGRRRRSRRRSGSRRDGLAWRLVAGAACRRPADRGRGRLVPAGRCSRTSTTTTSAARSTRCSRRPTALAIDHAEQTLWGESADAAIGPAPRRAAPHPAAGLPPASRRAGGRPLEYVVSPLPRRPLPDPHVPGPGRPRPGSHRSTTTSEGSTRDHRRRHRRGGPPGRASTWRPVQKFGRSLMLPIAALPAAALLLRLGQPDLLGADGLGWDKVAAVVGGGRRRALRQPAAALRASASPSAWRKKADGSTALAAVVGYLVFKGVGDADVARSCLRAPATGRGPGADQLRRARRHRDRA